MADLKEKDMPIGSASYLRGVNYNGTSVRAKNIMNTISKVGTTVDCNEMKEEGRWASNLWANAPTTNIAILEVIFYTGDWIVQRFNVIPASGQLTVYVRCFYNGTTWSAWKKII